MPPLVAASIDLLFSACIAALIAATKTETGPYTKEEKIVWY
jgi:hypothetical protein